MVFDISEIKYLFIVLNLNIVEYLFFFFLLFVSVGIFWIVKISSLTLVVLTYTV